jgi:VanZ family protein
MRGQVTVTARSVMDDTIQASITIVIQPPSLFSPAQWQEFLFFVRKGIGHFALNMINGILGFLTFYAYLEPKKYRHVLLSLAVGIPLSMFHEGLQFFTPGRSPTWNDVFYNVMGYITAQGIMLLLMAVIYAFIERGKEQNPQP